MKKQFLTAFALIAFSVTSFASERIINIDLFKNKTELASTDKNLTIFNFAIVNADKKVKIVEDEYCGVEEISCTERIVLEREKVLQLTLQYDNGNYSSEDSSLEYVEFNFPLNSISEEELKTLKSLSGFWDLTGKKVRARKAMAKRLFTIDVKIEPRIIDAVDYRNSTFCDMDDRWCEEDIRYVKKEIKVQAVTVNLK